ncbi:hypothetical protein ECB_01990 [Escherichia coli B str. REL606]|nr:hypothetical protein ECB_01990 [Escherichia coli B str. REL606]
MDETTDKEKVGNLPASIYCGIPSHSGFVATHNYLQRNKEKMKIQAVWYKEIHQTSNTPYMCPHHGMLLRFPLRIFSIHRFSARICTCAMKNVTLLLPCKPSSR